MSLKVSGLSKVSYQGSEQRRAQCEVMACAAGCRLPHGDRGHRVRPGGRATAASTQRCALAASAPRAVTTACCPAWPLTAIVTNRYGRRGCPSTKSARAHRHTCCPRRTGSPVRALARTETRCDHRASRADSGGTIRQMASPASLAPTREDIRSRATLRCRHAIRQTRHRRGHQIPYLAAQRPSPHRGHLHPTRRQRVAGIRSHHEIKSPKLLRLGQKARLNTAVHIAHQQPPPSRALTQQQRLAWLNELLGERARFTGLPRRRNPSALIRPAPDQDRRIVDRSRHLHRRRDADLAGTRTDPGTAAVR